MKNTKKTAEERAYERYPKINKISHRNATLLSLRSGQVDGYADAIRELVEPLEAENVEQARLLGMSGERELALRAELDKLKAQRDQLLEALRLTMAYASHPIIELQARAAIANATNNA